jgi:hypothetical protein
LLTSDSARRGAAVTFPQPGWRHGRREALHGALPIGETRRRAVRRIVAGVAVVSGIGLIVLPSALSPFPRAAAGQRVLDRFRQTMSVRALHSLATNFGTMSGAIDQFIDDTSPHHSHELRMTPAQFAAYERQSFPAVSAAVYGIPPLVAFAAPVNAQLQMLHPQFAAVDSCRFSGFRSRQSRGS